MPLPELVHDTVKKWIKDNNGPIKCKDKENEDERHHHTKLMAIVRIAFKQSNYPVPKNLRKFLSNLLQKKHREVIIKGDRKGELPGLHHLKVKGHNASEKQKESKRKYDGSEKGNTTKKILILARYKFKRQEV